jgi:hypothetical protein
MMGVGRWRCSVFAFTTLPGRDAQGGNNPFKATVNEQSVGSG